VKTIVVGYDDTEPSQRALERAAQIAEKFGSQVLVASVARLTHSTPKSAATGPPDPNETPARHQEELEHAQQILHERGIEAEAISAFGDPGSTIARVAAERHADLVVVGTRELGLAQRLLGQSVSQAVTRRTHCDVLIVHPEHH
jgi:nucleotide-binding universal stress UspA family protein